MGLAIGLGLGLAFGTGGGVPLYRVINGITYIRKRSATTGKWLKSATTGQWIYGRLPA